MANSSIKMEFIRRALERYGESVVEQMAREIDRMKIKDRTELLASLGFRVKRDASNQGRLELIMLDYGPFQDMGVGRGAGFKVTNGRRRSNLTRRRPRKFYSPVAYGKLNSLIGTLQFGLTEEVIREIKASLE